MQFPQTWTRRAMQAGLQNSSPAFAEGFDCLPLIIQPDSGWSHGTCTKLNLGSSNVTLPTMQGMDVVSNSPRTCRSSVSVGTASLMNSVPANALILAKFGALLPGYPSGSLCH